MNSAGMGTGYRSTAPGPAKSRCNPGGIAPAGRGGQAWGIRRWRPRVIATAAVDLRPLVDRLEAIAARRLASNPRSEAALSRARRLADHVRGHVRVRAASLDAPLIVVLLGPTGAGKSTLFNTIAGRAASPTGV